MRNSLATSLIFLLAAPSEVFSFSSPRPTNGILHQPPRSSRRSTRLLANFLKQMPDESDADFMKRLRLIASDPEAFERAVRQENNSSPQQSSTKSHWTPTSLHTSAPQGQKPATKQPKSADKNNNSSKGYQRVEDWEHDQQQMLKDMTWEQRVKFEGQRDGNRFQQNEILRNSLKRW